MIKVWPKGIHGVYKKFRAVFKVLVSTSFFDNFMLLSVLLNTVLMASEHHGIDKDVLDFLEEGNYLFTWIFIIEMSMKLLGIGFRNYC